MCLFAYNVSYYANVWNVVGHIYSDEKFSNKTFVLFRFIYLQEGRPDQRNASDAAALAAKVAKKEEMKKMEEGQEQRQTNSTVVRKKTNKKKEADLDDLLSAGLAKGKKK